MEGENHDPKQAVFLLTAPRYFPVRIFVDLPFLFSYSNVRLGDDDAYSMMSWLGQNDRDNHFEITLFYVTTTKIVSHQQLCSLIFKEDSTVLEGEPLKLSKYLLN